MMEEARSLDRRQAVESFLRFAGEVSKLRERTVERIEQQDWVLYPDEIEPGLPGVQMWSGRPDDAVLLSVERLPLPQPPQPAKELEPWLCDDWRKADGSEAIWGEREEEQFSDDPERERLHEAWAARHAAWREDYGRVSRTLALFNRLYSESQRIEASGLRLMASAGSIFFMSDKAHGDFHHPVDVQPVLFLLDTSGRNPRLRLVWSQDEPARFRMDLFSAFEGFRLDGCTRISGILQSEPVHPFDPGEFLKDYEELANTLSPHSAWLGEDGGFTENIFFGLKRRPVIWIQSRPAGVDEAVQVFLKEMGEGGEAPEFLMDLTAGRQARAEASQEGAPAERAWSEVSGVDEDVYLAKPANAEQLRIAKLLAQNPGVLVQGPPGTGKTHTIANLIGHLLALGRKVLVTSQKPQALAVLKEKLPEALRPLCISDTGEKNDIEQTVKAFTQKVGDLDIQAVEKRIERDRVERKRLIAELADLRKTQFALANREAGAVVLDGETWSLSKLGAWLREHEALGSVIPFPAAGGGEHFPLTDPELLELYGTAERLSPEDEADLEQPLPELAGLPAPEAVRALHRSIREIEAEMANLKVQGQDLPGDAKTGRGRCYELRGVKLTVPEDAAEALVESRGVFTSPRLRLPQEAWLRSAAQAGVSGEPLKGQWELLLDLVEAASQAAQAYGKAALELPVEGLTASNCPEVMEAVRELREAGLDGEPGFFKGLFHKKAYGALDAVTVNGRHPRRFAEFSAIELCRELLEKRQKAQRCWSLVVDPVKGPAWQSFGGAFPELEISSRAALRIREAIAWWSDRVKPVIEQLQGLGVSSPLFDELVSAQLYPEKAMVQFDCFVSELLAGAIAQEQKRQELKAQELRLQAAAGQVRSGASGSRFREALERGIKEDPECYEKTWRRIQSLQAFRETADRRKALLERLVIASPEWAAAVKERRAGFSESASCPVHVQEAWKWLRLNARFEEYLKEGRTDIGARIEEKSERLRQLTAVLASELAWLHASREVRGTQRLQTLNAWLSLVRKIGKGTGKNAMKHRAEARSLLQDCGGAVPAWIMPLSRALSAFAGRQKFDVVIVDEASQSDVSAAPVLFLGRKVLIVGDEEQVSPLSIGMGEEAFGSLAAQCLKSRVINWQSYFPQTSLYDLARTTCMPVMLKEHFRCVPEIIGFCNQLSYGGKILPLRDGSMTRLKPAIIPWRVEGCRTASDANLEEADAIARLVRACIAQPEYAGKTFGVVVMRSGSGSARGQVAEINQRLLDTVDVKAMQERRIRVGLSADFQGDERDVILLSLVDSSTGDGRPLRTEGFGRDGSQKKRWNVAVSRAKDQLWIVHSFDPATELTPGDIRRQLFEWAADPHAKQQDVERKADSPFEAKVAESLVKRGYQIEQQHQAGGFFIDIVVSCKGRKAALECDGEAWHSDEEQVRNDLIRQAILERLGWRFIRLRGGEYFRDPDRAIDRVCEELAGLGVYPSREEASAESPAESDLLDRVKAAMEDDRRKEENAKE